MNDEKLSFCASDSSVSLAQPQSNPKKIRLLLIDDQNTVRQMLRLLFEAETDLEIVGSVADGETALQQIEILHPDIAIVDIEMPGMDGLTVTRFERGSVVAPKRSVIYIGVETRHGQF